MNYLYSKLNNNEIIYPENVTKIDNYNQRKRKKISKYTNEFNSIKSITGNIILTDEEKNILLDKILDYYGHKGIIFMRYEILRRKFIWKNYFNDIKLLSFFKVFQIFPIYNQKN